MAQKTRFLISNGSPQVDSSWLDQGENAIIAAATATTSPALTYIHTVPTIDLYDANGNAAGDSLGTFQYVQRLDGAQIVPAATLAAAANGLLQLLVYRAFGQLLAQITAAGGALTNLLLAAPGLNTPLASGQTFTLTNAAGTAQTWTTSAAVKQGALTVPVNSQTPSATYNAGTNFIGVAGNGPCFGWLAATGTPTLILQLALVMPAIPANIALKTVGSYSFLPLYPGDAIAFNEQTASTTVSFPALTVTDLIL